MVPRRRPATRATASACSSRSCALCSPAARVGLDVQPWTVPRQTGPNDFFHCFIVLDPARLGGGLGGGLDGGLGGGPGFEDRLSAYLATMRALPGSVQVPGDPEKAHEAEAAAHGVALHPNVAAAVKALALRWTVERGTARPRELRRHRRDDDGTAKHELRPEGRTAVENRHVDSHVDGSDEKIPMLFCCRGYRNDDASN